jgi:LacI family transcriptional regulator
MNGVTLRDVAARAQVHLATASRALDSDRPYIVSGERRERVRATAADELHYHINAPAPGLRKGFVRAMEGAT